MFVYLNNMGETIARSKIEISEHHGVYNNTFWCLGEKENWDNIIILIDLTSQNITRKTLPNIEEFYFYNHFIICYGETKNYDIKIFIIDLETSHFTTKKIAYEKVQKIEDFTISNTTLFYNTSNIIFVYENGKSFLSFDFTGTKTNPSHTDIESAKQKLFLKQQKQLHSKIESTKKSYAYWCERCEKAKLNIFDKKSLERAKQEVEHYKNKLKSLGVKFLDE